VISLPAEVDRLLAISQHRITALEEAVQVLERDQMEAYPPCVLHGAPQVASLRLDARGATAWLNWESSALGDPRWDVACVVNELQRNQLHHLAEPFCERYADHGGLPLRDMAYWQAVTALHRWALKTQVCPTTRADNETQPASQLEQSRRQAWWALARLRDTETAVERPTALESEI
jgi:aminoglycoside phosphotransferase (APT) family kinase protein